MSRRTRALKKEIAHLNALHRVTQYLRFKNAGGGERLIGR